MILQIKTEKELIEMVEALQKEVDRVKLNYAKTSKLEITEQEVIRLIKKNTPNPVAEPAFSESDFLDMRDKHVTIDYVNRLYNKGGK